MKKLIYTCLSALIMLCFTSTKGSAQTIASYYDIGNVCYFSFDSVSVSLSGIMGGEHVRTYWGDGTTSTDTVLGSGGASSYVGLAHNYASAGTYTVKIVLLSAAGSGVDSVIYTNNYQFCHQINMYGYNDVNSNCTYDTGDGIIDYDQAWVEIDSAGHIVDTVTFDYWHGYQAHGPVGTVYTLKLVHDPYGYIHSCPSSGIITYTVSNTPDSGVYFGFNCDPSAIADNAVSGYFSAGLTGAWSGAYVSSSSCAGGPVTLTITNSPKYSVASVYVSGTSTPSYTVAGNIITVNLTGVSDINYAWVDVRYTNVGTLTLGDTANTKFYIPPVTGETNLTNNTVTVADTIRSSYDPNEKSVYPAGNIVSGTKLQYMIAFENTGNAPAQNIHVLDTLSDNVDVNSIKVLSTTANMNMSKWVAGGHNIVKFDFPSINLLDSSHHAQCDGAVTFTINSKTGLANGTKIDNRAGIYFDTNPVVMTNNVENKIGIPTTVGTMSNVTKAEIYPNPVNSELTVKIDNGAYSSLTITNTVGQVLTTQAIIGTQTKVNVKAFPVGIYFITLKGDSGVKVQQFEKN